MDPELRQRVVEMVATGLLDVVTDPLASPTGYPFKIVQVEGTASDGSLAEGRRRSCNIGLLREAYEREDGSIGYRCPSEMVDDFVRKGGTPEKATGRKCLCNGLLASIGLGQRIEDQKLEPALVTAGDALANIITFLPPHAASYSAADVLDLLLQPATEPAPAMALPV
jgi:nitronate monooxygenase